MDKQIFINLAVKDLSRSEEFYTAFGFTNNPQFSDETGKCMVWSDHIFLMLLTHEKFSTFAPHPIADTHNYTAALYSLSMESIDGVNKMVDAGIKAGGREVMEMKDYGFMQMRTLADLDGHLWEIFYMDMSKIPSDMSS